MAGAVDGQSSSDNDSSIKLADFTMFLMKLMQRLESQTHSNISDNVKFEEKVNDTRYIEGRKNHLDLKLPKSPEDFL